MLYRGKHVHRNPNKDILYADLQNHCTWKELYQYMPTQCFTWLVFGFSADVKGLRKQALERPFPVGHSIVIVEALEPSCSIAVSDVPPSFQDEVIGMYFERFTDKSPDVKRKGETKVVVTFERQEGKLFATVSSERFLTLNCRYCSNLNWGALSMLYKGGYNGHYWDRSKSCIFLSCAFMQFYQWHWLLLGCDKVAWTFNS